MAFPSSFHPQQHPLPRVDPARDRPLQQLLCASGADTSTHSLSQHPHTRPNRCPRVCSPTHRPQDPAASRVRRPRNSENARRMLPPGRRPDAALSAGLTGSRHPTGSANRHPVCRVGMSPLSGPRARPPPLLRPPALFKRLAVLRPTASEVLPKIGRVGTSAPVRGAAWRQRPGPSPISPLRRGSPCSSPHEEPPPECSRISPPGVSTAPLSSTPSGVVAITVHQPNRMPLHVPLVATAMAGQLIAAQAAPGKPRPDGPQRKARSQKAEAVLVDCVSVHLITACNSYSGRKPAAPIVLSGSWPCHPSTRPTSRSSQPACRRISVACPQPSTRRTPR